MTLLLLICQVLCSMAHIIENIRNLKFWMKSGAAELVALQKLKRSKSNHEPLHCSDETLQE